MRTLGRINRILYHATRTLLGSVMIYYAIVKIVNVQFQVSPFTYTRHLTADMTKKQARTEAKNFLAKINTPTLTPETAVTFTAFVDSVYMPRVEQGAQEFLQHTARFADSICTSPLLQNRLSCG